MSDFSDLFNKIAYYGKYKLEHLPGGCKSKTYKINIDEIEVMAELAECRERYIVFHNWRNEWHYAWEERLWRDIEPYKKILHVAVLKTYFKVCDGLDKMTKIIVIRK